MFKVYLLKLFCLDLQYFIALTCLTQSGLFKIYVTWKINAYFNSNYNYYIK